MGPVRARRRLALVVAGVSLASTAVGVIAGRQVRSPAEAAAERDPVSASAIRVPVERRVLAATLTARGDVGYSDAVAVELHATDAVVTEPPPVAGDVITEGARLVEVGERPVLVLQGTVPMYRDLLPGTSGIDVRQLEEALARLGLDPGPVDGAMDAATVDAVRELYVDRGYPPAPTPPEAEDRVRAARAELEAAQAEVPALAEALAALRAAEADLSAAEVRGAAEVVRSDAELHAATVARDRAAADASTSAARADAARNGRHPDTGAPPTPDEQAELDHRAALEADAATTADRSVSTARAARDATVQEQAAAVERARGAVAVAAAQLQAAEADASDADDAVVRARRALDAATATAGGGIPRDEVVFAPVLPAAVTSVGVALGDRTEGVLAEISGSRLEVVVDVATVDLEDVEPGAEATVDVSDPAIEVAGTVVAVDAAANGDRGQLRVTLTDPAATDLRGRNARVRIALRQTRQPVLVVPVSAVVTDADGDEWVEAERAGRARRVEVTTGLVASGHVEVTPQPAADLRAGDLVTVGRQDEAGP